jgi:magnesium chelatase subunit H
LPLALAPVPRAYVGCFTLLNLARMFTQVRSANRRVSPGDANGRAVMKAVYVVLEPQYQNALTQAATSLNDQNGPLAIDLSGYLIEELRDPENYADFCADVARPMCSSPR